MHARALAALRVEPGEGLPLLLACAYFFCLLCSYYILRPIRDEMGIQGGVANLQWVFTGTFAVMLLAVPAFGWAVSRFPRRRLLPLVYGFFALNLIAFYLLFRSGWGGVWAARAFFIWVSVFNLFVVSVFWSFMADIFSNRQARRLFGVIAVGGSAGAIAGPGLTALLAGVAGPANLLPLSTAFLIAAVLCVHALGRVRAHAAPSGRGPRAGEEGGAIHGGVFAGAARVARSPYLLGIAGFMLLFTTLSTFLYFEQAHIVRDAYRDPGARTALFARIDLAVNVLTVSAQLFLTSRLVERLGVAGTLTLLPLAMAAGFVLLGAWPGLAVLVAFQVIRRAGDYAIGRPAREMLYTVIPREDKYKSKNFLDTVVYRGGDALSGWAYAGLAGLGVGLSGVAFVSVPLALLWAFAGWWLGQRQETLRGEQDRAAESIA